MAWTQPLYEQQQVREAGRILVADLRSPEDHELALAITNNWRSAHGYPLNALQMNLRRIARKFDEDPIVAQRIKRLSSITAKLQRLDWLTLDEMQDLGGCRAVMSSVETVQEVSSYCREVSRWAHALLQEDDYLTRPKRSGYRGIHLIYAYAGDARSIYNGMKIEIQIRSGLQHAWATAVETVATFTAQSLKASLGDADWLRFFALMSAELAAREGCPLVPRTPEDPAERRSELRALVKRLRVIQRLDAYGVALQVIERNIITKSRARPWIVLELEPEEGAAVLTWSEFSNPVAATEAYNAIERATEGSPKDAVLVRVDSLDALRTAYPNYFADTAAFLEAVRTAVA